MGAPEAKTLQASIEAALDAGFRHLDETEAYQNTEAVGRAVQAWLERTGRQRSELFGTSKVFSVDDPGIAEVCNRSLAASGLGYYDLYLIHAPFQVAGKSRGTS